MIKTIIIAALVCAALLVCADHQLKRDLEFINRPNIAGCPDTSITPVKLWKGDSGKTVGLYISPSISTSNVRFSYILINKDQKELLRIAADSSLIITDTFAAYAYIRDYYYEEKKGRNAPYIQKPPLDHFQRIKWFLSELGYSFFKVPEDSTDYIITGSNITQRVEEGDSPKALYEVGVKLTFEKHIYRFIDGDMKYLLPCLKDTLIKIMPNQGRVVRIAELCVDCYRQYGDQHYYLKSGNDLMRDYYLKSKLWQ